MSNAAPPRIHCLPRTLAYPGLSLGKWSNLRGWTKASDSELLFLDCQDSLPGRSHKFPGSFLSSQGKLASFAAFAVPPITSASLVCNA